VWSVRGECRSQIFSFLPPPGGKKGSLGGLPPQTPALGCFSDSSLELKTQN